MSVKLKFDIPKDTELIFNEEALKFLEILHNKFDGDIKNTLSARIKKQKSFD